MQIDGNAQIALLIVRTLNSAEINANFVKCSFVFSDLIPQYSDEEKKLVFFDARETSPLSLSCKTSSTANIKWLVTFIVLLGFIGHARISNYFGTILFAFIKRTKNGTELNDIPHLKGRFEIHAGNLIIKDTKVEDDGNYTCSIPETKEEATIQVIGML